MFRIGSLFNSADVLCEDFWSWQTILNLLLYNYLELVKFVFIFYIVYQAFEMSIYGIWHLF